jgi:hypothetical protein
MEKMELEVAKKLMKIEDVGMDAAVVFDAFEKLYNP